MRNAISIPHTCPSSPLPLATPPLTVLIQLESKALLHLLHRHPVEVLRSPGDPGAYPRVSGAQCP
jgi:hypothetical protein